MFWVCCLVILLPFGLTGCSSDDRPFVDNEPIAVVNGSDVVKGINVSLSDFVSDVAETRTAYADNDGGVKVTWAAGDTIGIFPNEGGQVEFPIQAGTESNQATFDGGGWALRASSTYAAYYPYSTWNSFHNNKTIQVDYTGQQQTSNGSTDHLGKYDYQATGGVQTNNSGYLNFQFQHLGALLQFILTVPKAGAYTSLTLTSTEKIFITKAELDISGETPIFNSKETSYSITLDLNNVVLQEDNPVINAFMMLAPVDLSGGTLELSLEGPNRYGTSLNGHELEAGKKFTLEKSLELSNIEFADNIVKEICVANWDTNNDGELSFKEAKAVRSLGNVFSNSLYNNQSSEIRSFNEFQYFTSITSLDDYSFYYCQNLESIFLPEEITSIGEKAFYGCFNLNELILPNGLKELGDYALSATGISDITLPDNLTTIGKGVFSECINLTNFTSFPKGMTSINDQLFARSGLTNICLPEGITTIGYQAFSGCSSLETITLPDGLITIGDYAFSECGLNEVFLPESLSSIGAYAFSGCSQLYSITLPNNISTLSEGIFAQSGLTSIPEGITTIGDYAFYGCSGLYDLFELQEGIISIGKSAFYGITSFQAITLPSSISTIGDRAFWGCTSLLIINCLSEDPPTLGYDVFDNTKNAPIFVGGRYGVDEKIKEAYKTGWDEYADRIYLSVEWEDVFPDGWPI